MCGGLRVDPKEAAARLRAIASSIDSSESPSRWEAAYCLRGLIAALDDAHPRSKKPLAPKAPPGGSGWDPTRNPIPQKLPGAVVNRAPRAEPPPSPDDKRLRKLDRQLDREKSQMPEYADFQSFVQYLDDEDRDTYTVAERKKFCELNKLPAAQFDEIMSSAGKHMIRALPSDKIQAPPAVIDKAAKELGVESDDVRKFLNSFEGGGMTDTKEIVEAMNEWLVA